MCFLAIPRVMAKRNIKFPWGEVAAYVSADTSGNALLQHMSKLTKKRAQEGLPVPEDREEMVQKSGKYELMSAAGFGDRRLRTIKGIQAGRSKPKASGGAIKKEEDDDDDDDDETGSFKPIASRLKAKNVSTAKSSMSVPSLEDSDSDDDGFHTAKQPTSDSGIDVVEASGRKRKALIQEQSYGDDDGDESDVTINQQVKKQKTSLVYVEMADAKSMVLRISLKSEIARTMLMSIAGQAAEPALATLEKAAYQPTLFSPINQVPLPTEPPFSKYKQNPLAAYQEHDFGHAAPHSDGAGMMPNYQEPMSYEQDLTQYGFNSSATLTTAFSMNPSMQEPTTGAALQNDPNFNVIPNSLGNWIGDQDFTNVELPPMSEFEAMFARQNQEFIETFIPSLQTQPREHPEYE